MKVDFDLGWLVAVALVGLRIGPLFVLAPVFGQASVPVRFRVLFAFALAATLVPLLQPSAVETVASLRDFLGAALGEVAIGISLAFGLLTAFAVFLFGGRLLDLQIGFGLATLIDPLSRNQSPLLGTLLNLLAIVLFFAVEAHHQLFRALAYSVQHIPLGRGISELHIGEVVTQFGIVFSYGLAIVAPAVLVLFLLDVAMALLGRTMPQMNVFVVSMPLKVAVGVATLALSTQYMLPLVRKIFESLPVYWNGVLGLGVRG